MPYSVTFLPSGATVQVEAGTTLLQAQVQAGLEPDAPCGGKGTCGKCRVLVLSGGTPGSCLACQTPVAGDMTVQLPQAARHQVLQAHRLRPVDCRPGFTGRTVPVARPALADARSDWERLTDALAEAGCPVEAPPSPALLSGLHAILEESGYAPYVLLAGGRVLQVRPAPYAPLLAAFDIGTTSVVCYLMDGISGQTLHVESQLNRQVSYGADVISRADFAVKGGLREISRVIRGQLADLLTAACAAVGRSTDDLLLLTVAGNTCMHHLFAGIRPDALLTPPYFPEVRQALEVPAAHLGLPAGRGAVVRLLPIIAGFVGADTSAAMLAAEFDTLGELSLLIDIGTNGELVLGDGRRRVACSTAAGPALEGAKISCGMRGADGAIDHVVWDGGDITFTTIGGKPPAGICGSGLIDLIAVLLRAGVLTPSGRFAKDEALAGVPALRARVVRRGRLASFVLAEAGADGKPVELTQGDVREVQLAKGAIAAGIELMCATLGAKPADIRRVFLAGAFGSYMDAASAVAIGMLPPLELSRVAASGSAAGAGAQLCPLSEAEVRRCGRLARETAFLELALHPQFQKTFIARLDF